jgi:predicted PP-loop superfamily ATPase
MAQIYSQSEFKYFCPVCRPELDEVAHSQKYDAMDMLQEMRQGEVDDGYTN